MSPGCTGVASFSLRDVMPATKTSVPPFTVTTWECVARTGKSAGLTIFFGSGIARLIAVPGAGVKRGPVLSSPPTKKLDRRHSRDIDIALSPGVHRPRHQGNAR